MSSRVSAGRQYQGIFTRSLNVGTESFSPVFGISSDLFDDIVIGFTEDESDKLVSPARSRRRFKRYSCS